MTRHGFARRSSARSLISPSFAALAMFGAGTLIFSCADQGFECGQLVPGSSNEYRSCNRSLEVCVCATGSCARQLLAEEDWSHVTDPDERELCKESRLIYVESPFADSKHAGKCVNPAHAPKTPLNVVLNEPDELRCPGSQAPQRESDAGDNPTPEDAGRRPAPDPIDASADGDGDGAVLPSPPPDGAGGGPSSPTLDASAEAGT